MHIKHPTPRWRRRKDFEGGEAKSKGVDLFIWSSNAGCSLLVCDVHIVNVVQTC